MTSEKTDWANRFLSFNATCTNFDDALISNSGVIEFLTSATGAIAVITPERGLFTTFSAEPSSHLVLIDNESFPTGTEIFKSTQHFESDSTPSLSAKSSTSSPEAAIQFAET